jgi:hypothetical protein
MKRTTILMLVLILFRLNFAVGQVTLDSSEFKTPPASVKVHTWWHWISGNITREGITKDLESMKQQGISQATILNVGSWIPVELVEPPVKFNSEEWFGIFKWALQEANRLGINIGVHNCDGWSTSGGPWITPEKSMKQYVWTKTSVEGGKEINVQLEQPQTVQNFYRDVAVVAFPVEENLNTFQKANPKIALNKNDVASLLNDGNPISELKIKTGEEIIISFSSGFSSDKIVIFPRLVFDWGDMSKITAQFVLSSSDDGVNYNKIRDFELVGVNKSLSISFPETKSKYYKIECVKSSNNYVLSEVELLSGKEIPTYSPKINGFLEKIGSVKAQHERAFSLTPQNNVIGIPEKSVINLTSSISSDGLLNWNAPKGRWNVIRFGYTTTGKTNGPATPEGTGLEVDKMDSAALDFHFDSFAGKLVEAAGNYTGNTFKFLLIDSWECNFQNWTQNFPNEFNARRGYEITPWIPVLCGEVVENTKYSEAFLHDFNKTISDLIDEKYFKHFRELCHRNQLEMHAEIIYGNNGDYPALDILKSNNYPDLTMTEFWAQPNQNQFAEYQPADRPVAGFPTFAALACNKQIIGSEAYTGYAHYSESPADLKPFGDAAYCSGINQMILHSYVHQPAEKKPGVTLMQFAAHFNRNNPWWEFAQGWMDYQSRIQYVLQKGEPVVDVIFYVGDQLPQYFSKSVIYDLPYGIQAGACNLDMLQKARIVDGKISFGGKQSFPILTLPKSTTMELVTLKRIAELVNDGLIIWGPKPTEMLSLLDIKNNTTEFSKLAGELWGNSGENKYGKGKVISGKPIGEVLNELEVVPGFATSSNNPKELMFIHKRMDDTDVWFVFNQQNKPLNRELLFRVEGKAPEIWNPENGKAIQPAVYSIEKNQTRIPVSFKPNESKIFVFRNGTDANAINKVSLSGNQIFPKVKPGDNIVVPQAEFANGKYDFTTNLKGEYTFSTAGGKTFQAELTQTQEIELANLNIRMEFFPISDEKINPVEITTLKSLTEFDDPAIKYFAGKVKYTIQFAAPDGIETANNTVVLNLGNMDATAEMSFNGKFLSYIWKPDTEINISGLLKEENTLEITVANVSRNRFIGDLIQYGSVKSLYTTSPITTILNKEMPLKPSGIMGPLKLVKYNNLSKN